MKYGWKREGRVNGESEAEDGGKHKCKKNLTPRIKNVNTTLFIFKNLLKSLIKKS